MDLFLPGLKMKNHVQGRGFGSENVDFGDRWVNP
jgi:hypothetical protein